MPAPISIPLSVYQVARLAAFQQDAAALNARLNDTVTAIIAGTVDPATLSGWDIQQVDDAIVCTPPASDTSDTGPALVA